MNKLILRDARGNSAAIAPKLGAWLLRYTRQTDTFGPVDVLHYSTACLSQYPAMHAGSFLMFPVAGHTSSQSRQDHFSWKGIERPMPLHGFARRVPWVVRDLSDTAVTLALEPNDAVRESYPFEFRLKLTYELRDTALLSALVVENVGHEPMPFSTGFHPYIRTPLTSSGSRDRCVAQLPVCRQFSATLSGIVAEQDREKRHLSTRASAVPARHFSDFPEFKAALIDEGSDLGVTVDADFESPFRCLTVWSPSPDAPFYCLEPRTALQDAFSNISAGQLTVLPPGAAFSGTMTLGLVERATALRN